MPRESIDTALEFRCNAAGSGVLWVNANPASFKGEEIGRSDNELGDAMANAKDLHRPSFSKPQHIDMKLE